MLQFPGQLINHELHKASALLKPHPRCALILPVFDVEARF